MSSVGTERSIGTHVPVSSLRARRRSSHGDTAIRTRCGSAGEQVDDLIPSGLRDDSVLAQGDPKGAAGREGGGATPSEAARFGAALPAHNQRRFKNAALRSVQGVSAFIKTRLPLGSTGRRTSTVSRLRPSRGVYSKLKERRRRLRRPGSCNFATKRRSADGKALVGRSIRGRAEVRVESTTARVPLRVSRGPRKVSSREVYQAGGLGAISARPRLGGFGPCADGATCAAP